MYSAAWYTVMQLEPERSLRCDQGVCTVGVVVSSLHEAVYGMKKTYRGEQCGVL